MKKLKVLALYRGNIFESRGTPIRVFNILSRLEKIESIDLAVFSWDKNALGFSNHQYLDNNHVGDIKKLAKYIREQKIDVVIGYTASSLYYLTPLKFLTRAKVSFESHGFIEDEAYEYGDIGWFKYKTMKLFFGFLYWLCDFVITSDGPSVGAVLSKYNKNVLLLTGGVDMHFFRPDAVRGKFIKDHSKIIIGYAGNARIWQGVDFLVETYRDLVKTYPNFYLVMLMSEKKDFGDDIEVFGSVSNKEVPNFLADCDILVIPRPLTLVTSIAYPSKLTEYLAMGKAVVGSNVGDMDKIIQTGENGIIYEAGNKRALIDALIKLQDPLFRQQLGAKAVETATKMSWDSIVSRLVDYLQEMV